MLDPFQIREKVKQIEAIRDRSRAHDALARARVVRMVFDLYREVLQEIARGSIDGKSLARAALEVESPRNQT